MKKIIKAFMPNPKKIREHKHLRIFGDLLHSPNLWHLNRRSVPGAFAVGLFVAFIPVPFQMVLAAAAAIALSVNLPISIALVWISNPVTMPPLFFSAYLLGAAVLGTEPTSLHFELTWTWLSTSLGAIWQPFLLGCFMAGATLAIIGYCSVRLLWRWHIVQHLKQRRLRSRLKHS